MIAEVKIQELAPVTADELKIFQKEFSKLQFKIVKLKSKIKDLKDSNKRNAEASNEWFKKYYELKEKLNINE